MTCSFVSKTIISRFSSPITELKRHSDRPAAPFISRPIQPQLLRMPLPAAVAVPSSVKGLIA